MTNMVVQCPVNVLFTGNQTIATANATDVYISSGNFVSAWLPVANDLFSITYNNVVYYFRWGNIEYVNGCTHLSFIQWNNGIAPNISNTVCSISIGNSFVVPKFGRSLCMIGDSITVYEYGNYFRQLLLDNGLTYDFIGTYVDTFGYQHAGLSGDTTNNVAFNRITTIPKADSYFILLGTNDTITPQGTINDLLTIVGYHLSPATVYISTIMPSTVVARNNHAIAINALMATQTWPANVKLIDLATYFSNISNWPALLTDGIHPNLAGYQAITSWLAGQIQ